MKVFKYLVIFTISLLILIQLTLLLIPLNYLKPIIIQKTYDNIGRQLVIDGEVKISLFLKPKVNIQKVKLASIQGAKFPWMIEAEEIKASIDILPLLGGKIVISEIILNKPTINLEVINDHQNWMFTKAESEASIIKESNKTHPSSNSSFFVKYISVNDATIRYIKPHQETAFNNLNLSLKLNSLTGPLSFDIKFKLLDHDYMLSGQTGEIKDLVPLQISLQSAKNILNFKGEVDRQTFALTGDLTSSGDLDEIIANMPAPHSNYELQAKVSYNDQLLSINPSFLKFAGNDFNLNSHYNFNTNNGALNLASHPQNLDIKIKLSNLNNKQITNISLQILNLSQLGRSMNFPLPDIIKNLHSPIKLITDVTYNEDIINLTNMNFHLGANHVTGNIKGKNVPLLANAATNTKRVNNHNEDAYLFFNLTGDNLKNLMTNLQISFEPDIKNFLFEGNIKLLSNNKLHFNINKSNINYQNQIISYFGNGELSHAATNSKIPSRLNLNLNLNLSTLNLNHSQPQKNSYERNIHKVPANNNLAGGVWPNNKIDLSFLEKIDGNFNININKVINGNLAFDQVKTVVKLATGKLTINSLTSKFYGGDLSAYGNVQSYGSQPFNIDLTLKNAELKNIPYSHQEIKLAKGNFDLKAKLSSQGGNIASYINNLGGKVEFIAHDGVLSGFDLQKVITTLKNIRSLESALSLVDSSFKGGQTQFEKLYLESNINQGIANLDKCQLETGGLKAFAKGSINLSKYSLDISANIDPNIKNIPNFGVRLFGSLNNPQHQLDTNALKQFILQHVVNGIVNVLEKGKADPKQLLKAIIHGEPREPESNNNDSNDDSSNKQDPVEDLIKQGLKKIFK